jgi:ribonuclease-3
MIKAKELPQQFRNQAYLKEALTHRSFGTPHNERLEFLGDSLLNTIAAILLFQRYPKLSEGLLSRLRAHLVCEATLAKIATQMRLGDAILLGEGELKSGGFRRPSTLANTLEAVIAAVFLDQGFDACRNFVEGLLEDEMATLDPDQLRKDPKTELQEFVQSKKIALPVYTTISVTGKAHDQYFVIECRVDTMSAQGEGASRKIAEQNAAKAVYEKLRHEYAS